MDVLLKYFPTLSVEQIDQFSKLDKLYHEWNERINVISRKDIENLYIHHVLHSLAIAAIIKFIPGTRIMDVGTGGGFPGIPLAIMFPGSDFTLVDSIGKKIKVVKEISAELGLRNVTAISMRAEDVNEKFDFVVSRAVKSLPVFYTWIKNKISSKAGNELKNGILYLKGGDISDEIRNFHDRIKVYSLKDLFNEEYFETKVLVYLEARGQRSGRE